MKSFTPFLLVCLLLLTIISPSSAQSPEAQLKKLGIELPSPSKPVANYVKYVKTGNLIFLAGHGPCGPEAEKYRGKVGKDLSIEQGYQAARLTGICLLSTLKDAVGDLSKVKRIVKVLGMVSSDPEFYDQPKVVNGCSDLMTEVFGEKGKHARAAVGMAALPNNIPIEIEIIVEVEE